MVVLAIDPGLRKSCGWAVLAYPSGVFWGEDAALWARKTRLLACGVEDLGRLPRYILASSLLRTARTHGVTEVLIEDFFFWTEKGERQGGDNPAEKRGERGKTGKGSVLVVSRMKEFIGYLHGFFSAHHIPVAVVHPIRWKTILARALGELPAELRGALFRGGEGRLAGKVEEDLLALFPEVADYPSTRRAHILSAVGLGIARIIEATAPLEAEARTRGIDGNKNDKPGSRPTLHFQNSAVSLVR